MSKVFKGNLFAALASAFYGMSYTAPFPWYYVTLALSAGFVIWMRNL